MPAIFLSYRRADTGGYAGRLADALEKRFGKGNVFQDVETIAPGSNFTHAINAAIARCQVLVVLIGDTWLTEQAVDGNPRLNDPQDFVRQEVASGLRAGTQVIPVLVEGTMMPPENALPPDLKPLARLQAIELSDTRWEYDVERLAKVMGTIAGGSSARRRAYMLAGSAILATIAGGGAYVAFYQPAQVSGRWTLPNGSFWIVLQDGHHLTIEETHYDSKQVWKRGAGTVNKSHVVFFLETLYGVSRRYEGTLRFSSDGDTLSGMVREANSGHDTALVLTRAR
jgi:hypothetical protein